MVSAASVRELLQAHWFDAVADLLGREHDAGPFAAVHGVGVGVGQGHVQRLATIGKRVLDLDAEDFGELSDNSSEAWSLKLGAASFPRLPKDPRRGALGSLVPLYELMLEVLDLRANRHEPLQVVVTAHLIGEYLCQLAWESRLGHGGDPLQMSASVGGRWGTEDPECPHSSALRATARRSLHACSGDEPAYTAYLDRFHSRLGDALAVCAMNHETIEAGERPDVGETCPNPCTFAVERPLAERRDLDARVRLAIIYTDSPIVALRHHAPVGHFFGVPSTKEISDAWVRTYEKLLTPWADGENPLLNGAIPGRPDTGEALPGMSALVSAVAGRTIGPGTVIRDIGGEATAAVDW